MGQIRTKRFSLVDDEVVPPGNLLGSLPRWACLWVAIFKRSNWFEKHTENADYFRIMFMCWWNNALYTRSRPAGSEIRVGIVLFDFWYGSGDGLCNRSCLILGTASLLFGFSFNFAVCNWSKKATFYDQSQATDVNLIMTLLQTTNDRFLSDWFLALLVTPPVCSVNKNYRPHLCKCKILATFLLTIKSCFCLSIRFIFMSFPSICELVTSN